MTTKESKILYRLDITYLPNGNIYCTSIDNYGKYIKDLPQINTDENNCFKEKTTIENLIQEMIENNFNIKTRAEIVQQLVDTYDLKYTKAASIYNKFAENKIIK
jgi:hypothetical protein